MEIGQKLPEVLGIDQDGKEWTLAELSGKKIVLYIYPRDSTPGCTNEACNLRDNYERFLSLGYVVIGVSTQDAKSHKKFIEKNNLPLPPHLRHREGLGQRTGRIRGEENVRQGFHGRIPHHLHR